jgi:hypothetical protein
MSKAPQGAFSFYQCGAVGRRFALLACHGTGADRETR